MWTHHGGDLGLGLTGVMVQDCIEESSDDISGIKGSSAKLSEEYLD
jgi:hypothetical protein